MSSELEARLTATLAAVDRMLAEREAKRAEVQKMLGKDPKEEFERIMKDLGKSVPEFPKPQEPEDDYERRLQQRLDESKARLEEARQKTEAQQEETLEHLRRQTALLERIADALERRA